MPHPPPQLFLIDGYALIYRAFFALITRPLRTSRGENTSAAWGVVNFLLRLRERYSPDISPGSTTRAIPSAPQLYAEYKSTREKLDERAAGGLRPLGRAGRRAAARRSACRWSRVDGLRGRRRDRHAGPAGAEPGWQVVIVSGDKDFYQLIGPRIALLNPGRGGPAGVEEQWVDESNAADRLGVPPSQVVDYLALVGDSLRQRARGQRHRRARAPLKLLAEFGSLDALLARAAEVKAKRAARGAAGQRGPRRGSPASW